MKFLARTLAVKMQVWSYSVSMGCMYVVSIIANPGVARTKCERPESLVPYIPTLKKQGTEIRDNRRPKKGSLCDETKYKIDKIIKNIHFISNLHLLAKFQICSLISFPILTTF